MNFNEIKTYLNRPACSCAKSGDNFIDLSQCQRLRRLAAFVKLYCRRCYRHAVRHRTFAACMSQLHANFSSLSVYGSHQLFHPLNLSIFPQAQVLRGNASPAFHCRGFHNNQPYLPRRSTGVVQEMPISYFAVSCGFIHAHRRHNDAVFQFQICNGIRCEQHSFPSSTSPIFILKEYSFFPFLQVFSIADRIPLFIRLLF